MIWFGTIVGFICAVAATVAYDQGNVGDPAPSACARRAGTDHAVRRLQRGRVPGL
jgi:hypothetical protein